MRDATSVIGWCPLEPAALESPSGECTRWCFERMAVLTERTGHAPVADHPRGGRLRLGERTVRLAPRAARLQFLRPIETTPLHGLR